MSSPSTDATLVQNGLVFDGSGAPGRRADILVAGGRVAAVSPSPLPAPEGARLIDASGKWVMPGFVDIHTHYDAEVMAGPGLGESVRHGVTTVFLGSCSISMVLAEPDDCADLFSRVEALPHDVVLELVRAHKRWRSAAEFRATLDAQPLGPNVCSWLGHSDLRARVMGLERSVRKGVKPSASELAEMERLLEGALDAGLVGLSTMTTRIDKMAGERAWSSPLPSTFASWREYRRLHRVLRRRGAVLQSAPNVVTQVNLFAFLWESTGLFRKPLKVSLLTAMDLKAKRHAHWLSRASSTIPNRFLRADFRWQALAGPFYQQIDGVEANQFEEFGGGRVLRDLKPREKQYELILDPAFRREFRRAFHPFMKSGLWHREIGEARVVECPDAAHVGRSFAEIAAERGVHPVDAFLDLAAEHKERLRWGTLVGNDRPAVLKKLLASPQTQIGFADSGAHVRNMAHYNQPLRLLKMARDDAGAARPFMTIERAVHRLTGELADWFGIEAGHLRPGDRADLVVVDPAGLTDVVFAMEEQPAEIYGGLPRQVNRNDAAVDAVLIAGNLAYTRENGLAADLGRARRFGRFLPGSAAARPSALGAGARNILDKNGNSVKNRKSSRRRATRPAPAPVS